MLGKRVFAFGWPEIAAQSNREKKEKAPGSGQEEEAGPKQEKEKEEAGPKKEEEEEVVRGRAGPTYHCDRQGSRGCRSSSLAG